ncbi:MAG: pyroglutamyl-peptidase I [Clostridia bacterium]|nr:pyroglutamyl-peptidase I [Clostridia bacterium]MBP3650900.1 pyroglutamyl-peptidase I [Clostridia bacterium]
MKKLLITGFDPFGGEAVNPSWEAVVRLDDSIGSYLLTKLQLPTLFSKAAAVLLETAATLKPDVILCIGQAGGRKGITPEVIGINLREARIPDNGGNQPLNQPVLFDGPAAYFATVPVWDMVAAMQMDGIPCGLSYSAGTFVCNDVLYSVLHHYDGTATRAGFIHVPYLPEQAKENQPSLPLEEIVRGLTLAIKAL